MGSPGFPFKYIPLASNAADELTSLGQSLGISILTQA